MKERIGEIQRQTAETNITMKINIDGNGHGKIQTGIGFFDHMLTAFAFHALFDLEVNAAGDLHIDAYHTIEDVGIVLGQAVHKAVGDKSGIARIGYAYVPMDEALGFVALDFSGRPYTVFKAQWSTPAIGHFPTDLIQHFFESLAIHGKLTIHAQVEGRNDHHKAESLFKALGRAMKMALSIEPRRIGIPSTKGFLE